MDAFLFLKEIGQFVAAIVSTLVGGLALHAWKTWLTDKKTTESRISGLEARHNGLEGRLESTAKEVDSLKHGHKRLREEFHAHEKGFIRVKTIVENWTGRNHPRLASEEDQGAG